MRVHYCVQEIPVVTLKATYIQHHLVKQSPKEIKNTHVGRNCDKRWKKHGGCYRP